MAMTHLPDLGALIETNEDATVSRTALRAEGVRIVLFSFDTGQELTEHTAAMPVLLHLIDGAITVTAGDDTVELLPGVSSTCPPGNHTRWSRRNPRAWC